MSFVTQDPVMFGGHDSIDDLTASLTTVVTCNRDKSTMVEELSGVSDAPLLITLSPKFYLYSVVTFPVLF